MYAIKIIDHISKINKVSKYLSIYIRTEYNKVLIDISDDSYEDDEICIIVEVNDKNKERKLLNYLYRNDILYFITTVY